jgi:hypothetical protein
VVLNIDGLPPVPSPAERVAALEGAIVNHAELRDGFVVLELRFRGTEDGAVRLVIPGEHCVATEWPW